MATNAPLTSKFVWEAEDQLVILPSGMFDDLGRVQRFIEGGGVLDEEEQAAFIKTLADQDDGTLQT